MSQIDAIFKFSDKATAVADAQLAVHAGLVNGVAQFFQDHCLELSVWRNSLDTLDGQGNTVHHPLAGYYVLVSLDHVVPALANHAALQVAFDRDAMNARQPGFVLKSNITNALLQDIRFPVFAGMDVPWGGLN